MGDAEAGEWVEEKVGQLRRNRFRIGFVLGIVGIIFLLFCNSFKRLGPYRYGLRQNTWTKEVFLEKGADSVYVPGVYFVGFWNSFVEFPSTIQTISYSYETPEEGVQKVTPLELRSKDAVPMKLEVSVQYQRKKEELVELFKQAMTDVLQENIFTSNIRAELTKVMSLHNSADCWEKREELIQEFTAACQSVMTSSHGICWGLQFYRSHMAKKYEKALIETQVQKQQRKIEEAKRDAARVRANTNIYLAGWRKNITVLQSLGASQRYNITRAAMTKATADKVEAEASAVAYVQEALRLPNGAILSSTELTEYQEALMLTAKHESKLYYGLSAAPQYVAIRR